MPSNIVSSVENNFSKGLVTEFTGLNFPENAAIDTDNCIYTLVGDTTRRAGINTEVNGTFNNISMAGNAVSSYKWNNVGGDGLTQIIVQQTGGTLYFYLSSSATVASPLSTQKLVSTISLSSFAVSTLDVTKECQFADGNGYLFVFQVGCDPFFCSYSSGTITATRISVKIRDFNGIFESTNTNVRPSSLSAEHQYNLTNQGWTQGNPWQATSTTGNPVTTGSLTFTVAAGLTVTIGDLVNIQTGSVATPGGIFIGFPTQLLSGNVTAYSGTSMTINVTFVTVWGSYFSGGLWNNWIITPVSSGYISTWHTAVGNYPSNSDVWWYFKDSTGAFNPGGTVNNVTLNTGNAPQGKYILDAFSQQRTAISSIVGLTDIITSVRPKTGTWFQGRVWYTGVDAQQIATGDATYYTWTENIYFSQIVVNSTDFGSCYQTNDPTSENLFDLLPTDGGVIQIQGAGSIYKLFPIQNGMLVFASNGIWFITGSQGIGFSANDYTITKISSVQSISSTSFVDVNGLPYFWNEEGIYAVTPSQQGGLQVEPLTVGTILTFYNEIPKSSKKFARGAYHPIDYIVQWVYRDTEAPDTTGVYTYNKVLNFNTYNKAFYPYTVDASVNSINGIIYVNNPGGITAPDPVLKYISSNGSTMTFADEHDTAYVDWGSINYDSFFVTGYKLHGKGQMRFQIPYIYTFSRNDTPTSFKIQGLWDYAITGDSGRWSVAQLINNWSPNSGVVFRRHKIRGRGLVLQIKITSVDGQPFDIVGWSVYENVNTGV